eukprot:TRINITY_DN19835_c0_g1_i1.p1 TRINITY_DN19835_c0_g1~~TRINITY_DN19835_c0_g1_i1.p1  ORF type:complete len:185 (+),score=34.37 TRINITY_DN19835_c0_g1_i1:185-739(+)
MASWNMDRVHMYNMYKVEDGNCGATYAPVEAAVPFTSLAFGSGYSSPSRAESRSDTSSEGGLAFFQEPSCNSAPYPQDNYGSWHQGPPSYPPPPPPPGLSLKPQQNEPAPNVNMTLSYGSQFHESGGCQPCQFIKRGESCPYGQSCNHCHLPHSFAALRKAAREMKLSNRSAEPGRARTAKKRF